MVALNPDYASSETLTRSKNRVGDFFWQGVDRVGKNRLSSRIAAKEKSGCDYETASGRTFWLSRDPFGSFTSQMNASLFETDAAAFYALGIYDPELLPGGSNIYGYVSNNTVNLIDPSGEVVPLVVIGAGIVGGLVMDYAIDKIKNRNVGSDCSNSSSTGNPALNAGVGGSVAATGPFQRKSTRFLGGGRSGDRTSVASRANHGLARRGAYSVGTRNLITKGLRKVPYVGAAIGAVQLGDAIFNPTEGCGE